MLKGFHIPYNKYEVTIGHGVSLRTSAFEVTTRWILLQNSLKPGEGPVRMSGAGRQAGRAAEFPAPWKLPLERLPTRATTVPSGPAAHPWGKQ